MRQRVFVYEYLSGGGHRSAEPHDAPGAALRAQGLAMRDAMLSDLQRADCSVSAAVDAPGSTLPPGIVPRRPRAGESAFDFVARESARHDLVWLVAPETGGVLAQLQRAVGPARWLGCSAEAIALASRKKATLARLAAHGLPTPLACADTPAHGRWVVKPDDGAGAVDTQVHASLAEALDDLALRALAGAPATLEPWIEGEALSLSLLCGPTQTALLSLNRQHITLTPHGRVCYGGVRVAARGPDDPRWATLAALATRVAQAIPGLRGFVGIDLVWHPRRGPVLIEVNPRLTCAYVGLSAALGRNLAADLLAAHGAGRVAMAQELSDALP